MNSATDDEKRRLLFVPCRTCGARVGEECDVESVVPTAMHPPRFQDLLDSNALRNEDGEEGIGGVDPDAIESARVLIRRKYETLRGRWHPDVKEANKDYYENIIGNLERVEAFLRDE